MSAVSQSATGAGGNRIVYDQFGDSGSETILLLHGAGQTRHSWRRVANSLVSAGYRAIVPDIRGHGDSDPAPDGNYQYSQLVGDVENLIAQTSGRAVIVGASLGGKIALATAPVLGAAEARGLVLVDAVPRSTEIGIARVAALLQSTEGFDSPQAAAEAIARSRGEVAEPDAGERLARNLRRRDDARWYWHYDPRFFDSAQELGVLPALDYLESAARRVRVPTLIVRGGLSDVVDVAGAAALAALIPHAENATVADAGHLVASERPDALVALLLPFLGGLREQPELNSGT